jgi:hypothetical protein
MPLLRLAEIRAFPELKLGSGCKIAVIELKKLLHIALLTCHA